ncbi:MAG: hypothetical protein AAB779_02885, partial [Patescibacteria group bacterium]
PASYSTLPARRVFTASRRLTSDIGLAKSRKSNLADGSDAKTPISRRHFSIVSESPKSPDTMITRGGKQQA